MQLNGFRSDYDKAQDNVEKLTIDGENKIGDDGLYYFYPDKNSLSNVEKKIKDNLNLK